MEKALIIYGSSMRNTKTLAQILGQELSERYLVTLKEVSAIKHQDIVENDMVILGSSTWNNGELADDYKDFYDQIGPVDLKGKKAAIFGTGCTWWDEFCGDMVEQMAESWNATIIYPWFQWYGDLSEQVIKEMREWAKIFNPYNFAQSKGKGNSTE